MAQKKKKSKLGSPKQALSRRTGLLLLLICTFITSAAQICLKLGVAKLPVLTLELSALLVIATNYVLIAGFILYGIASVLFLISLKNLDLSVAYPVISLSFAWVYILSIFILGEKTSILTWAGIAVIILGVSFLGRAAK